jgi:signal peptidase I
MSGSGTRDGYGSPPWDPADPVPDLDDTQAIPGLGTVQGPGEPPGLAGGPFGSAGDADDRRGITDGDTADGGGAQGRANKGSADPSGKHTKHTKNRRSFWRELPVLVVVALVLALLIKSFLIQAFYIPSA